MTQQLLHAEAVAQPLLEQIFAAISQQSSRLEALDGRILQIQTTTNRAFGLLDSEQTELGRQQARHDALMTDLRLDMRSHSTQVIQVSEQLRAEIAQLATAVRLLNDKYHQISNYVGGQENRIAEVSEGIAGLLEWQGASDERLDRIEQAYASATAQRADIIDHQRADRWLLVASLAISASMTLLGWLRRRRADRSVL